MVSWEIQLQVPCCFAPYETPQRDFLVYTQPVSATFTRWFHLALFFGAYSVAIYTFWGIRIRAEEDLAYQYQLNGLFRANSRLFIRHFEDQFIKKSLYDENTDLKREILWRHQGRDNTPL